MADNNEIAADFVTILSSELIAEIVEAYFNEHMYKVAVRVVDLKPTSDGYAFSLAFDDKKESVKVEKVELCIHNENIWACWQCEGLEKVPKTAKRAKNGQFKSVKEV